MSNSSNGDKFSITDDQVNFINVVAETCSIPGTCVCFLVLVAYGIAACFPRAQKHMDRVSFRLLVYTLIFNVIFGIAYAATPNSPGAICNFGAFCVNLCLSFSTFFTTCIAINLQLVVVHHVDGQRMEKYYLIGTTLLTIAINVPTFALHQFGWDEGTLTCWYKNSDPTTRLHWIIGTQSFWIALAATIETICSCIVLVYIYIYQRNTKALIDAAVAQCPVESTRANASTRTTLNTTHSFRSLDITQNVRYRKAILRIVLYPITSLIVNYSTVALDLHNTILGVNNQLEFRLLILDMLLYGIRTLSYGLLAACDPSFTTALQEMLGRNNSQTTLEFDAVNPDQSPSHSTAQKTLSGGREILSNVIGYNEDRRLDHVENTRQDLEISVQYNYELESSKERQL